MDILPFGNKINHVGWPWLAMRGHIPKPLGISQLFNVCFHL